MVHLCKSQQKDYSTFADELADFIQVQKARGIKPKAGQVTQQEEEEGEAEEALNKGEILELNKLRLNPPPISHPPHPPHPSRPGCHYTVEGWRPPYQGPSWLSHGWDDKRPPPALPGPPLFSSQPTRKRRHRKQSSSSSYTSSSSSSSSYSSSTSDSGDSEHRRREKRRIQRSRRERDRRARDEDKKKRKQQRRRDDDSVEGRREDSGGSGEERKKGKSPGKQRRLQNKLKEEDLEAEGGERVMDTLTPGDMMNNRKETEEHIQAEMNVEQGEGGQDTSKAKYNKKEKKKTKETADTRTEEEKLWDDSILGC